MLRREQIDRIELEFARGIGVARRASNRESNDLLPLLGHPKC
jgi:hypothetical protein